jgi:hypothetical protein
VVFGTSLYFDNAISGHLFFIHSVTFLIFSFISFVTFLLVSLSIILNLALAIVHFFIFPSFCLFFPCFSVWYSETLRISFRLSVSPLMKASYSLV